MTDHGFTAIAPVDILDAVSDTAIPVKNGKHLTELLVGSNFDNYDYVIVLSHFKGHPIAGFGGAVKNLSVGMASARGKHILHNVGSNFVLGSIMLRMASGVGHDVFLESMAEAAGAVIDRMDGNIVYINVMNRLYV